jgi:hypothetical protein
MLGPDRLWRCFLSPGAGERNKNHGVLTKNNAKLKVAECIPQKTIRKIGKGFSRPEWGEAPRQTRKHKHNGAKKENGFFFSRKMRAAIFCVAG